LNNVSEAASGPLFRYILDPPSCRCAKKVVQ